MAHPFICSDCQTRSGIYDIATGISECWRCGTTWVGPRVQFLAGTAADEEVEAFIEELKSDQTEALNIRSSGPVTDADDRSPA